MLVTKIGPKIRPYILAAGLAVGTISATAVPMRNDKFEINSEKEIMAERTNKNDKESGITWLSLIQWVPLAGPLGVLKPADYIEQKEDAKEQKESVGKNKEV